jgi:hypothetical protein
MIRSQATPIPGRLLGQPDHHKSLMRSDLRTAAEDEAGHRCVAGLQRLMPLGIQCILEATGQEKRVAGANLLRVATAMVRQFRGHEEESSRW